MSPINHSHNSQDNDAPHGARFRNAMARIIGDIENPLTWSVPMATIAGIRVRIHLLFILYAVAQVLWSIRADFFGPGYTAMAMAILFTIVLLHEFGHCLACRLVDGDADEILMWPLGGLAFCHPPDTWRANLITTIGGPLVNVAILPITSVALWSAGRANTILFNPFELGPVFFELTSWWLVALWLAHAVNLVILLFNILMPIFPLDGGRIMQALIWRSQGKRRSIEIASGVGMIAAAVLAVFALVADTLIILGIALFGGGICWFERRRLRTADALAGEFGAFDLDEEAIQRAERREAKRAQREAEEQEAIDRILAKIAQSGMKSLTHRERRTLRKATNRQKGKSG